MSSILDLLKISSRSELAGDRVTSYGWELGGGSINYWDGGWDNDEFLIPVQLENIIHNRDGCVDLFDLKGQLCEPRMYFHQWQPSHTETHFILPHYLRVEQTRWICDDVVCVKLRFLHANQTPLPIMLRWPGELLGREVLQQKGRRALAHRSKGRLAGIHRLFGHECANCRCHSEITRKNVQLRCEITSQGATVYLFWAFSANLDDAQRKMDYCAAKPEGALKKTTKAWERFFDRQVPKIEGLPRWLEKQYYSLFYSHKANEYSPLGGHLVHPFTCPSKFRLLPQWFWDSAFHSIVEKWLYDFKPTQGSILNILEAAEPDGHLPFCLHQHGYAFDKLMGFQVIQPWVLPIAVWEVFCHTGDINWLKRTLPAIVGFDAWLENNRSGENGLVYLRTAGESGWDNSARFMTAVADRAEVQTNLSRITPTDFNAIILRSRQVTQKMAALVGNQSLADEYQVSCKKMTRALKKCWNDQVKSYVDCRVDGSLSDVLTPAGFVSMLPMVASKAQARKMHTLLRSPSLFWTTYPIPTLVRQHRLYSAEDDYSSYWNGRTWPPVNWLVIEGLLNYGFTDTSRELITRSLEIVSATGEPLSTENYNPEKAQKYEISHNIFNYGWGGLPNDMLLKHILGIKPAMHDRVLRIEPLWMDSLHEVHVTNLHMGGAEFEIDYKKHKTQLEVVVKCKGRHRYYLHRNGEEIRIGKGTRHIVRPRK